MPKEKKPRTIDIARTLALPVSENLGLTLWDIRFEKEGVNWYLRYFLDKPGGININDCEAFSRAVDKLLDEADPIEQSYILEVSSPGVPRTLTRPEHFALYLGQEVNIRLIRPREELDAQGQRVRELQGQLVEYGQDGTVSLQMPDGPAHVTKAEIAKVTLVTKMDFTGGKP